MMTMTSGPVDEYVSTVEAANIINVDPVTLLRYLRAAKQHGVGITNRLTDQMKDLPRPREEKVTVTSLRTGQDSSAVLLRWNAGALRAWSQSRPRRAWKTTGSAIAE